MMIRPNLCISDLSVFVSFQHEDKETDGTDLTSRFVAKVKKPIQGDFPSRTFFDLSENLIFLKSDLIRVIVL